MSAESSKRPSSLLNTSSAAIGNLYEALNQQSPVSPDVRSLITALKKCETAIPIERSKVVPRQPFIEMFMSWKENDQLTTEELRMKCLVLVGLCLMLRPSDLAPKAVTYK